MADNLNATRSNSTNDVEHRRTLVAALMLSHRTQRQMVDDLAGQQITVSVSTVNTDVAAVREDWRARAAESYDTHVAEQTAVIDAMLGTYVPKALRGDIAAAEIVRKFLDRRSRLLGLDKPVKVAATVDVREWESQTDQAIRELLTQMDATPDPVE